VDRCRRRGHPGLAVPAEYGGAGVTATGSGKWRVDAVSRRARYTRILSWSQAQKKVGLTAQDTAELVFTDVRIPTTHVLGEKGRGFFHLMEGAPRERLSIAVGAIARARAAYEWTKAYVIDREVFKTRLGDLQNTRFVLVEMLTEIEVTQLHVTGVC
jgi:alkylation response protein AidB-like acyl-CoA dehydrogenase